MAAQRAISALVCAVAVSTQAASGAGVRAFVGATIHPVAGAVVVGGTLVVEGGRVVAVGASAAIAVPAGAEVIDLVGRVVVPGLIDTHSHVGEVAGGDASAATHPAVRALDGIDIHAASIRKAQAGGITTVNVMPGSGHLLSGQTAYLKLRGDGTRLSVRIEDLLLCTDAERAICGGLKMANGTNPQRTDGGTFPETRGKAAAMARELWLKAIDYRDRLARAGADPTKRPDRDLGLEAMVEALAGRRIVHHHTHRADDIATVLRLAREFGFRVVLHHLSEGFLVVDAIAAAGVGASINVVDAPGGKHENSARRLGTLSALHARGVSIAVHTDDPISDSRFFLRSAALAVRGGLPLAAALEALTLSGARMLGLESRVGSLEPGKDADFVVLSGDPFGYTTQVEQTWVEGERVFDRATERDRGFQVGAYGLYPALAAGHVDD